MLTKTWNDRPFTGLTADFAPQGRRRPDPQAPLAEPVELGAVPLRAAVPWPQAIASDRHGGYPRKNFKPLAFLGWLSQFGP